MDPIIIGVVVVVILMLLLRMFFGMAKMVLRLVILVAVGVVVWRLMHGQ